MKRSTFFLSIMALIVGIILFKVKYEVVDLEQQLAQTAQRIQEERENIHMLQAEWTHLNDPKRLQNLAKQLDIGPVRPEQIVVLMSVPKDENRTSRDLDPVGSLIEGQ